MRRKYKIGDPVMYIGNNDDFVKGGMYRILASQYTRPASGTYDIDLEARSFVSVHDIIGAGVKDYLRLCDITI